MTLQYTIQLIGYLNILIEENKFNIRSWKRWLDCIGYPSCRSLSFYDEGNILRYTDFDEYSHMWKLCKEAEDKIQFYTDAILDYQQDVLTLDQQRKEMEFKASQEELKRKQFLYFPTPKFDKGKFEQSKLF